MRSNTLTRVSNNPGAVQEGVCPLNHQARSPMKGQKGQPSRRPPSSDMLTAVRSRPQTGGCTRKWA